MRSVAGADLLGVERIELVRRDVMGGLESVLVVVGLGAR